MRYEPSKIGVGFPTSTQLYINKISLEAIVQPAENSLSLDGNSAELAGQFPPLFKGGPGGIS